MDTRSFILSTVIMQAVFGSAFQVGVSSWCLKKTGPVFVSMFKPLGIVITVVVGIIFLGETFYLGRLGFYQLDIFLHYSMLI